MASSACSAARDANVDTLPCSLLDLLLLTSFRAKPDKINRLRAAAQTKPWMNQPAMQALREQHQQVRQLQTQFNLCFIVLSHSKRHPYTIVYDGSRLPTCKKYTCWVIRLTYRGQAYRRKNWWPAKVKGMLQGQELSTLLSSSSSYPPATDYNTTKAWLQHFDWWGKVNIKYCVSLLPRKLYVDWITAEEAGVLTLEAFLGPNQTLMFAHYQPIFPKKKVTQTLFSPAAPIPPPSLPQAHNMSSAVSIQLQGLTSAYFLGIISQRKFVTLSTRRLNKMFGALWIHLDDKENVRHLAYSDYHLDGCQNFEIFPPQGDGLNATEQASWEKFFNFLWQRHVKLCTLKKLYLAGVLDRMRRQFPPTLTSKHSRCLNELQKFASKTRIVLFSTDDRALHALKLPFTQFVLQRKTRGIKGVMLKTNAQNNIVSLAGSFMQIDNVAPFFAATETTDFLTLCAGWLTPTEVFSVAPCPLITASPSKLGKQKTPVASPLTLLEYLNVRGRLLVNMLHLLFDKYCRFIVKTYHIDLHTWPIQSLTSLAFHSVWLKYTQLGGPLLHGPEKTKPFYEQLLRRHSRGGFSWSFAGHLASGDTLGGTETAHSVREFDICSSYGYAASQMLCPGGFCVGYMDAGGHLERHDNFRHKRFEFRGTYKFIHDLSLTGAEIIAVYSNYHTLGILYLGKYPVDLCIITSNVGSFIIQFDHMYTHGCKQGCPGLFRYASRKTRAQVEEHTALRDQAIQQWADQAKYTYAVISECHSPGYSTAELEEVFAAGQPLHFLIQPYLSLPVWPRSELLHQLPTSLTYIMFCRGQMDAPRLFVWDETQHFAKSTPPDQDVMLTRQHYEYLCQEHNFQLESITAVLFYKTDTILPQVFAQLTQDRYSASSQVGLIKCLINYACGYFGYNAEKKKTPNRAQKWLVTGLNPRLPIQNFAFQVAGEFNQQTYFTRCQLASLLPRKTPTTPTPYQKPHNAALPIFCAIIDLGKLRLAQCFLFIDRVTRPGSVQLLYTHIDNMILATSSRGQFEELVAPDQLTYFQAHQHEFFAGQQPQPGQLKEEFVFANDHWKFASPFPCFYSLVDGDKSISKTLALNNISPQDSYQCALNLLEQIPVHLTQQRRVNKLANTLVQTVHLTLANKKTV